MRTILVTVGTSLLGNAKRDRGIERPTEHDLTNYIRNTDPEKVSAETNSLNRILEKGDKVIFLHSETEEGRLCASILSRFYGEQDFHTLSMEVENLTYAEKQFKMRGLRSLVAKMIKLIEDERNTGNEVLINATGGFKAEIAYATLVGLLFDTPVYYIHDAFKDIIDFPPVPISWDLSLIEQYVDFFRWIDEDLRQSDEVDRRLRGFPPKLRVLLTEEEGYTFLSPAGEAFYQAWRRQHRMNEVEKIPLGEPTGKKISVLQGHRTLWGHVKRISDVKDGEVRKIFQRILSFDFVESISLGRFHTDGCETTMLRNPKLSEDELKIAYTLYCRDGTEDIIINVKRGYGRKLLDMLGREVHP